MLLDPVLLPDPKFLPYPVLLPDSVLNTGAGIIITGSGITVCPRSHDQFYIVT